MKRIFVAVLAVLPACTPVVTHAPRVERGFTGVVTVGAGASLCDTSCDVGLVPQAGYGIRYGRPAEGRRWGYSVGGTMSVLVVPSEVDLYVQVPTGSGPWATGAGVVAGLEHAMPYVQLGRLRPDGSGWYVTHGFALMGSRDEHVAMFREDEQYVRPRYWAPSVTYRTAREGGAMQVYVSGALGWSDRIEDRWTAPRVVGREPVRSMMMGVTLEQRLPRLWPF